MLLVSYIISPFCFSGKVGGVGRAGLVVCPVIVSPIDIRLAGVGGRPIDDAANN